ncbi:TonB-dependent receptor [Fulvitalea axinellae]
MDTLIVLPDIQVIDSRILERSGFKNQTIDTLTLKEYRSENLAEVLTMKTSIFIKSYGPGGLATPSFRGTGASHTQVYWNGINLNSPTMGQTDLSLLPIGFSDMIDVNFGASSLLYGTGGLGGAIRLGSNPDAIRGFEINATQYVGSFGTYTSNVGLNYGNGTWQGVTKIFYKTADNDFEFVNTSQKESHEDEDYPTQTNENAELRQWSVLQEVYRSVGQHGTLAARVWYQDSDRNLSSPMNQKPGDDNQKDETLRTMLEWKHNDENKNFIQRAAYVREQLDYSDPKTKTDSESVTDSYFLNGVANFKFGEKVYLNSGYNLRHDEADTDDYQDLESGNTVRRTQTTFDIYSSVEWHPAEALEISFLLRQQWIDGDAKPLLPSLGANYQVINHRGVSGTVRANVSKSFHAPSLNDRYYFPVGNPDLLPEEGNSIELGTDWVILQDNWHFDYSLTAYASLVDNWIVWRPGVRNLWAPENLREVYSRGLENSLGARYTVNGWTTEARVNYSYIISENQKSYDGNDDIVGEQMIYVPKHNFNATLRVSHKGWYAVAEQLAYGKRNIRTKEEQEDEHLAPYYLTNLSVGRNWASGRNNFGLRLKASNLFDYTYQSVARRPMPGRYYSLTLNYGLNPKPKTK